MSLLDRANFPKQDTIHYQALLDEGVQQIIRSGQTILGPGVLTFETSFAAWLGGGLEARHCLGVGSGTDALELALRCAGVSHADKVLVPSHTAYATVAAILRIGAFPIFVDLAPGRMVICPGELEQAFKTHNNVAAVIAVHLYGESCDILALQNLCRQHAVPLIEDCAQATGTTYQNRNVGTWGDFAAFSFYPTKNLGALGDGGLLVVNAQATEAAITNARRIRFYGWDDQREAVQFGVNSRLDELQAWILNGKLEGLNAQILTRRRLADLYRELLSDLAAEGIINLPGDGDLSRHSYHLFVIQMESHRRAELIKQASEAGIPLGIHYSKACHQHPFIFDQFQRDFDLPITESVVDRVLSLPINPYLIDEDIALVCEFLSKFFRI
jgi:aminotransferase EvaB